MKLIDFRVRFHDKEGELKNLQIAAFAGTKGTRVPLSIGVYKSQGGGLKYFHERDATLEEALELLRQMEQVVRSSRTARSEEKDNV